MISNNAINPPQSPEAIRALGGILIFLGVLLTGGMGAIMMWINNKINNPSSSSKFNGTSADQQIIFLVLGMVAFFGLSAIVAGTWQVLTGKRSKTLIWMMLGLGAILFIMAKVIPMIF